MAIKIAKNNKTGTFKVPVLLSKILWILLRYQVVNILLRAVDMVRKNTDHNSLIYNRTNDSPNNHACSHANSYAWDNGPYESLHLHDGGVYDVVPYVVYDEHPHEFYDLHREGRDDQGYLGHHVHVALQKRVKLDLKSLSNLKLKEPFSY